MRMKISASWQQIYFARYKSWHHLKRKRSKAERESKRFRIKIPLENTLESWRNEPKNGVEKNPQKYFFLHFITGKSATAAAAPLAAFLFVRRNEKDQWWLFPTSWWQGLPQDCQTTHHPGSTYGSFCQKNRLNPLVWWWRESSLLSNVKRSQSLLLR